MAQKKKDRKSLMMFLVFGHLFVHLQARDALEPARREEADRRPELAE